MYSARYSDRLWKKLGFSGSYMNLRLDGYPTGPGVYASASNASSATSAILPAPPLVPSNTGAARFQIGEQGNNGLFQDAIRSKIDYTLSDKTTFSFQYMQLREQYGYNASVPTVIGSSGPITSGTFFFNYNGLLKQMHNLAVSVCRRTGRRDCGILYRRDVSHILTAQLGSRRGGIDRCH